MEHIRRNSNIKVVDVVKLNLIKSVVCDKPCSEGYEAENLTSANFIVKNKGFLAERFIKPPVTITFNFKCEIKIKYIAVSCKVGAQKSTGIELYTESPSSNGQYVSIASGVLQDSHDGFVFHEYDLGQDIKNRFGDRYYFRTFRSNSFGNLSSVTGFKVKIFRTMNGIVVPAIGKLEIWGNPTSKQSVIPRKKASSSSSLTSTRPKPADIYNLTSQIKQENSINCTGLPTNKLRPRINHSDLNDHQTISTVPEDFIDPITCEVMSQPLIMPSGKVIDNSTLEQHLKAEQYWGRGPNDPFTGIPFTDTNKPVAASELKVRIDKYLSKNCNKLELLNVPRIVGGNLPETLRKQTNSNVSVSKLIKCSSVDRPTFSCIRTSAIETNLSVKRRRVDINKGSNSMTLRNTSESNPKPTATTGCANSKKLKPSSSSFQEMTERSLETALKSMLSKLPKLTGDKPKHNEEKVAVCNHCKSSGHLFQISCLHFVCRNCLTSSKYEQRICSTCSLSYCSKDVQKVHVF